MQYVVADKGMCKIWLDQWPRAHGFTCVHFEELSAQHALVTQHVCRVSKSPGARQARHDDVEELYAFSSARKMASVLLRAPGELMLYNKARCACPAGPNQGVAVQDVSLCLLLLFPAQLHCRCKIIWTSCIGPYVDFRLQLTPSTQVWMCVPGDASFHA